MDQYFIIIILLLFSAFFSWSELAIMSVPLYKIKKIINDWVKNWKLLLKLREKSERTIIWVLIWNNIVNTLISVYASIIWDQLLEKIAITWAVAIFIMTISIAGFIIIFWEILPKIFASKYAIRFALFVAPLVNFIIYFLFPIIIILESLIFLLNKFLWKTQELVSRDDVEIFVDEWKKQWIFNTQEYLIIKNLLDFEERNVESIVKHRTDLFALSDETILKDTIDLILKQPYSRIPIFNWDKDNILWILTLRDIFNLSLDKANLDKKLKDFKLRWVHKIPTTANLLDLFIDMKIKWFHFALVCDEFWWIEWIVTFEDILQDLVWDIKWEYDVVWEEDIILNWENSCICVWNVQLRDILYKFNISDFKIPIDYEDEIWYESMISYIILLILKRLAKVWDVVNFWNIEFKIIKLNEPQDKIEKIEIKIN